MNFKVRGQAHHDWSRRCCRLGFNDAKINDYKLFFVYPNPFNPFITFDYYIKKTGGGH